MDDKICVTWMPDWEP